MNSPEKRNVIDILRLSTGYFEEQGIDSPRLTAEVLLSEILGCRRIDLYLWFDRPVKETELTLLRKYLRMRARGVPVEYITGTTEFYGLRLQVNPSVMIPRPETEILVEKVLHMVEGPDLQRGGKGEFLFLDFGTGSGAISVAILSQLPGSRAVATDISMGALQVARGNARQHDLHDRFLPILGDLEKPLRPTRCFDLLVSNPPYVAKRDRNGLPREVRNHEPHVALFAGEEGLLYLRRIVMVAPELLKNGGILALEVGDGQGEKIADFIHETAGLDRVILEKDLSGIERIVLARREE
jgi:release factor glutamine methyltransferase